MEPNKHGGNRPGSGRKKVEDKKVTLSIYPRQSIVDAVGVDQAKDVALKAIERKAKNILKKS